MRHWTLAILYALVIPGFLFWLFPGPTLVSAFFCLAGFLALTTVGVAANLLLSAEDRAIQEHIRLTEEEKAEATFLNWKVETHKNDQA
jgi:hypothetical protein